MVFYPNADNREKIRYTVPMPLSKIDQFGERSLDTIERFGHFVLFCMSSVYWMFKTIRNKQRWRLLMPQFYEVGTRSLPVVMITGGFIGMVLAIELYAQFEAFGQETRLGGVINITVVKHIGPVLAAVMLAGRVGGAFSAELGTMAVTEQIDAMRVMAADPVDYLVVPRLLACIFMIPLMTIFSDILGIYGAWYVIVEVNQVTDADYWAFSASFVSLWDLSVGILKSLIFGIIIGLVCCYKGFYCSKGAEGVGKATTEAFVTSFICIIIMNFFLAKLSNDLYHMIFGYQHVSAFG